jgi:prepilin-type N-terminal cleavage/methylation domain-containing protein
MNEYKGCNLMARSYAGCRKLGFTLIELLVVITIIALLAALLFPVFATAQENSRQSSTMTHLEQIQSALALYKLDNHTYPQVLFGYAVPGKPMSDMYDIAQANASYGTLFPTYINDFHVFESNDNPVDDNPTQTVNLTSLELGGTGTYLTLQSVPRQFYVMDGFDASPQIAALGTNNQFINGTMPAQLNYVLRYQRDWTSIQNLNATDTLDTNSPQRTFGDPTNPYYANYLHQMRWQNPPGDSYVTSTTYHIPDGNRIILLFESGSVSKVTPVQLGTNNASNVYDDSTSCSNTSANTQWDVCQTDANGDNPAKFWKIANTQ